MIIRVKNDKCIYLIFCETLEILNKVNGVLIINLNMHSYIKVL